RRLKSRVADVERAALEDQVEGRRGFGVGGRQLRVEQVRSSGRLEVAGEGTAALERAAHEEADQREAEQDPRPDEGGPAEAVDEATPACEHGVSPSSLLGGRRASRGSEYSRE